MPGIAHLIYGFTLGLLLLWVSDRKFSIQRVMVFGVNSWFGPDIGALIWYITRGQSDVVSYWVLLLIHNPYHFPLTFGLPLAYLWHKGTRLSTERDQNGLHIVKDETKSLSVWQCFVLVTAGSYSHFLLDYIFDANGWQPEYRWVLSTGAWNGTAYFDAWLIIPVLLTTGFILLFLYVNNPPNPRLQKRQLFFSALVLFVFTAMYLLYLWIRIQHGLPAIGEEADFGVVTFLSIFLFFPIFLCILSTKNGKILKQILGKKRSGDEMQTSEI